MPASVIESPISDAKLAALGVSREKMLDRIRSAVSFASGAGIKVAFFGVDSSRADLDFYRKAYDTAVEAGAQEVVVVDTIGIATPEAAAFLVGQTVDWLGGEIPVHWHGHDDFGLGTAAAVAAVQAGATWVQGTINGMGERAGNADLIEVALALEALYGIPTRLDLTQARVLSQLVQKLSGTPLPSWKAVTGNALFTRESGAVAAQFHDPPAIEPYSSELVGATRGSCSGRRAASTRFGSRPPSSGWTWRKNGSRTCWQRSRRSASRRDGSSATTSSAVSRRDKAQPEPARPRLDRRPWVG